MNYIQQNEGRDLFGGNTTNYLKYRPPYPNQIFNVLWAEWNHEPGTHTLEIGAGPGLATTRVVELGANPLLVIVPDIRFNPILHAIEGDCTSAMLIINQPFEDVELQPASFDMIFSATAFHWIDRKRGLERVAEHLREDGVWAMWWNIFGDPCRPYPFHDATKKFLENNPISPTHQGRTHFVLDRNQRVEDILGTRRLRLVQIAEMQWSFGMDTTRLRELYSTFSPILKLDVNE